MKLIDLTGQRFGWLTVIARAETQKIRVRWLCRCDCGAVISVAANGLCSGDNQSCGCRKKTKGGTASKKRPREYTAWCAAKGRCYNPNNRKYQRYGGRGIAMCQRWSDDFDNFIADMGKCPDGLTLERIDLNGHYEPNNCRWATAREQARNRRNNVIVHYDETYMTLAEYAEIRNLDYARLNRLFQQSKLSLAEATARMSA